VTLVLKAPEVYKERPEKEDYLDCPEHLAQKATKATLALEV
jgi:hypothetical protein